MTTWLKAMGVHDFTGVRARAQWEQWQEEKKAGKRKIEKEDEEDVVVEAKITRN